MELVSSLLISTNIHTYTHVFIENNKLVMRLKNINY